MSDMSDDEILEFLDDEDEAAEAQSMVSPRTVKGALTEVRVMTDDEAAWFDQVLQRYQEEYKFENIADLQDLDRLVFMEMLSYRYATWMLIGHDYDAMDFDEKAIRDTKGKIDQEIRLLKQHMGMNRRHRVESEQESVGEYLKNLLRRAEEFGVHRDAQVNKAFDMLQEIFKRVGLYYRGDEEERRHLGVEPLQILDWIWNTARPDFEAIDDAFRQNQRIWIREVS